MAISQQPQNKQGLTYEELVKKGAKPVDVNREGLTYEELISLGAKPVVESSKPIISEMPKTFLEDVGEFLGMEKFARRLAGEIGAILPEKLGGARETFKELERMEKEGIIAPGTTQQLRTGGVGAKEFLASAGLTALNIIPTTQLTKAISGIQKLTPLTQFFQKIFARRPDILKKMAEAGMLGATYGTLEAIKEGEEITPSAIQSGLLSAGAIGALGGLGKGVGKILKNLRGTVKEDVIREAQKLKIDLPASAKVESKVIPLIESTVAKGFWGAELRQKVQLAKEKINQIADNLVKQTGETDDLTVIGQKIVQAFDKFRDEWLKTKNALYEKLEQMLDEKNKRIRPLRTIRFLKEVIERKKIAQEATPIPTGLSFFEEQLSRLRNKNLTIQHLRNALIELNDRLKFPSDPFIAGNRGLLKKMITIMSEDLDDKVKKLGNKELVKLVDEANRFYQEGIKRINSAYGKKIHRLREQPSKILPVILSRVTPVEDVPKILEIVGKKALPSIQAGTLKIILSNAKRNENLVPGALEREIQRIGEDKLRLILTPKQMEMLNSLRILVNALGKLGKIEEGSQTAFLLRPIIAAGTAAINPFLALKLLATDYLISKFVSSKRGQKFLVEGIGKETAKKIEEIGKKVSPVIEKMIYNISKEVLR